MVAVAHEWFQLYLLTWEIFGVLDGWLLIGGICLQEVVAHGSWTVLHLSFRAVMHQRGLHVFFRFLIMSFFLFVGFRFSGDILF